MQHAATCIPLADTYFLRIPCCSQFHMIDQSLALAYVCHCTEILALYFKVLFKYMFRLHRVDNKTKTGSRYLQLKKSERSVV